jgi:carbamoyltransferase
MLHSVDRGVVFRASTGLSESGSSASLTAGGGQAARTGSSQLTVGVSGLRRNAAAAVCVDGRLTAFCEQERLTRVRGAGLYQDALPAEAVAMVLKLAGSRGAQEVSQYAIAEEGTRLPAGLPTVRLDHHHAHAAVAYGTSPFEQATVLVCDNHSGTPLTVWLADAAGLTRVPWDYGTASGLATLYSECAGIFGFAAGQEHQFEALARLHAGDDFDGFERLLRYADGSISVSAGWRQAVSSWLREGGQSLAARARIAAAFQRRIAHLLTSLARDIRVATAQSNLCLGGGLFFNTYLTTCVRQAGAFDDVFVAPNPGNAGLAAGAALAASTPPPASQRPAVSPFLGPAYDLEEIKATLDNCKLSYECLGEGDVIAATVDALRRGHLVGWYQGRMEWAHRALGNRSILASPLSPYVLDNLNVFLKQRPRHRAYGLSVTETAAPRFFSGPPASRFMEYEYAVSDRDRLRQVLPEGARTVRVQTVTAADSASRRFELLHEAFGEATGVPVLVNTSFNGFSEPIVCSPRDAVRVFFGTGLDVLVLDRFIIRK